ncbi:MAG: pitrilysin family protein, partial [Rhodospirillales bacterium]|nr:pitrilysin family protein [Rhodospirillales bacterium]
MKGFFAALALLASVFLFTSEAQAVQVERVISPGGIEAWLVRDKINPIVTVSFSFRGGGGLDPLGKGGLANLVSATLDEGAGGLDSQAFQSKLEDLSISLSFDAGRDSFGGSLRTLSRNLDTAFDMLRLAIMRPRFDTEAVERMRASILAGLRRSSENPRRIANRALMRSLFPGHAYGRPTNGRVETVNLIKINDLKVFAAQRLARDNLIVSVVGDIGPKRLAALLDTTFGGLPEKATPWKLPDIKSPAKARTILIEKKVPQSVIRFGQPGIKREDPDFYAAYVMNYVLGGGGFASRLYEEVREKRGLVYDIHSYTSHFLDTGAFSIYTGVDPKKATEALQIGLAELARFRDEGPSAEELTKARELSKGRLLLRMEDTRSVSSWLGG